jgi:hypothetical protein
MSLALPPVGTHSTELQLVHVTTVWEWLNTVVLRNKEKENMGVSDTRHDMQGGTLSSR